MSLSFRTDNSRRKYKLFALTSPNATVLFLLVFLLLIRLLYLGRVFVFLSDKKMNNWFFKDSVQSSYS